MVARTFQCDESRLRSFLDEELPDVDQAQLGDHLDHCPECRRTLERLAAGSRLWGDLHALSPKRSRLDSPEFAIADPETSATFARPDLAGDPDQALDFLASSTTPGSLGRLGTYEVTELLGRGGFGIVLKAFDSALGRAVAIKVLAPQLATSAAARSRFAREARAAAAVVHEHVVAIHAVDSWNGFPYLVMPYISGCSLQERVDSNGPMDVKSVLRIGTQTAQGLAAAHAQGLVHRDVKPSNILLENGVERVKLTDFGLARAVDDASLTQSGVVAGTPQFMSPEQARGEPVDHRSDLFSLGSVLYTMCAGHPPFRAGSTPAVLRRVCDEQPRLLGEVNSDVPVWLADIVERLHAKDPADRFASATELADLLERALAALQRGLPIAPIRSARIAPRPSIRDRKTSIAAVLSISIVALAAAAWARKNLALDEPFRRIQLAFASDVPAGSGTTGQEARILVGDSQKSERIVGSGTPAVKTWDVSDFTAVQISSTFHAQISKGSGFKVTTTADDNVLPFVRVVKDGKTLKIGLEDNKSYQLKKPLEAEITLPELTGLDVSGAAQAALKGFQSEKELTLRIHGASKVEGSFVVAKADFEVHGASSLSLSGSAQSARLSAHGASHFTLPEFLLKECTLDLAGASEAQLSVQSTATFSAKLAGASHLKGTVTAKDVKLELTGASHAKLRSAGPEASTDNAGPGQSKSAASPLDAQSLTVTASGASSGNLQGKCKTAVIEVDGASHLNLKDLVIQTAEITISGVSHANLNVTEKLSYDVSSVSHLRCVGKPATVSGKKSGGAHVSIE
jgi:serine/threonine protein kinase